MSQTSANLGLEIAQRLRPLLKERRLTAAELARQLGIPAHRIQNLASGRSANPGCVLVRDLAHGLGVSSDYLLGLVKAPAVAALFCQEVTCLRQAIRRCEGCEMVFCAMHLGQEGLHATCWGCLAHKR